MTINPENTRRLLRPITTWFYVHMHTQSIQTQTQLGIQVHISRNVMHSIQKNRSLGSMVIYHENAKTVQTKKTAYSSSSKENQKQFSTERYAYSSLPVVPVEAVRCRSETGCYPYALLSLTLMVPHQLSFNRVYYFLFAQFPLFSSLTTTQQRGFILLPALISA